MSRHRRSKLFAFPVLLVSLVASFVIVPDGISLASTTSKQSDLARTFRPTVKNACQQGELAIAVGNGNGAAGTGFQPIVFVNDSTNICWLKGYASVTLSNPKKIDSNAVHKRTGIYADPKPQLVVLRPSQVASIGLSYNDNGTTNAQGVSQSCPTYRTINIKWVSFQHEYFVTHLSAMNYPCGQTFAVTPFENGASPAQS